MAGRGLGGQFVRGLGMVCLVAGLARGASGAGFHFPPPGETLGLQGQREPLEVGLDPALLPLLASETGRYALWRHGHLVAVDGDFFQRAQVASLRKTWHAFSVGGALAKGRIPSLDQPLSALVPGWSGHDALATWRHVLTQSSSFVHPGCGDPNDYLPGEIFTYSDSNVLAVNRGLAAAFGKSNYKDHYEDVLEETLFGPLGLRGWSLSYKGDGVRLHLDLEDMGRLGLLAVAGGAWDGAAVVPPDFADALETRQTGGLAVDYVGCEPFPSEELGLDAVSVPVAPYGFMTWLNAEGSFYPDADPGWAFGAGVRGFVVYWNRATGIVLAAVGADLARGPAALPALLDAATLGPNPWFDGAPQSQLATGAWVLAVAGDPSGAASRLLRVVDAGAGVYTTLSASPLFERPIGLAVGRPEAFVLDAGRLLAVQIASGEARVVSEAGLLAADAGRLEPLGIALDGAGRVWVPSPAAARLLRVDPATGAQTVVSQGGLLVEPIGVAPGPGGALFVADRCAGAAPACSTGGALLRIDPASGAQSLVASLLRPAALEIFAGTAWLLVPGTSAGRMDAVSVDLATGSVAQAAASLTAEASGAGFARNAAGELFATEGSGLRRAVPGTPDAPVVADLAWRRSTPLAIDFAPPPRSRCGLGFEVVPVVLVLGALRSLARSRARPS